MTAPLIAAKDVSVRLDGRPILQGIDVEIAAGEIVTIVGPNGSGKSTFLRALIGAVPLAQGRVTRAPGLRIGYVPQKLALDASLPMTVQRFLGLPRRVSAAKAREALANAGVPDLSDRQMTDLSGGQFQRVLLARALLEHPQLLLLDEATQGLDQPGAAAFYQRIEQVRQELGCAIVMVSHDLHVVMAASDRVLCLNGHICCQGSPQMVADAPEYRALFGSGTKGTMALYRHQHSHSHDHDHHHHDHEHEHEKAQ
ncbi:Mn2+/Zn2+ABC transporter ATP-binding protein [Ruegeria marisrubri]|uniref:Mn2+/Zn2+ABC transporter ATP-binding protein n=1 Tax=Ruegeria marisrubri TaxID=1685379 RepID=A0A0X3TK62_9RHOB|nr:metal ABC transporter ATP-binding protein [Ruegeria marisrubri]KUJ76148.1 Mn2+/Zn2+ABC transporter ATP-binding protein [Ruegeria marisrubri]